MSQMPVDPEQVTPQLRREALLPNERSRGLGTVAVVCTMAGVASGLALATTLMAMQVADSMSMRAQTCPTRTIDVTPVVEVRPDHGFLGIRYVFHHGVAEIDSVLPGTPAEASMLRPGDHVIAIDGIRIDSASELQERIFGSHPGAQPTLTIDRDDHKVTVRPTLIAWPAITY
jgi:S1-C subfamily serine protease